MSEPRLESRAQPESMTRKALASLAKSHQRISVLIPNRGVVTCAVVQDPTSSKTFYLAFRQGSGRILEVGSLVGHETQADGPNQARLYEGDGGYIFQCAQPVVRTHYKKDARSFNTFPRLDKILRYASSQKVQ